MNIVAKALAGYREIRYPAGISSGGYGSAGAWMQMLGNLLPGSDYDYRRRAGKLWQNSIVLSCIKWQSRVFPDALLTIYREDEDGQAQMVKQHPLLDLLKKPNSWCDWSRLQSGILISHAVAGNSYLYKLRSAADKVVGLVYLPHYAVHPVLTADGSAPLSHYLYEVNGQKIPLRLQDVVHIRNGCDPDNPVMGLSDLGAVLREVCTDNEAATLAASLLRNGGVPPLVLTPKLPAPGAELKPFNPDQRKDLAKLWKTMTQGDMAGTPLVPSLPMDVVQVGYSPAALILDKLRDVPEERITSALGIPAVVAGLGAGLDAAGDRNLEAMERWAWQHNVIPTARTIDSQITESLLPDLMGLPAKRLWKFKGPNGKPASTQVKAIDGDELGRDYRNVAALQEDLDAKYKRLAEAIGGPYLSPNDGRRQLGEDDIPGMDALYPPPSKPVTPPASDAEALKRIKEKQAEEWRKRRLEH